MLCFTTPPTGKVNLKGEEPVQEGGVCPTPSVRVLQCDCC